MNKRLVLIFSLSILVVVGVFAGYYFGKRNNSLSACNCPICQDRPNVNASQNPRDGGITSIDKIKVINGLVTEFSSNKISIDTYLPVGEEEATPVKESYAALISDKTVFASMSRPESGEEDENGAVLLDTKILTDRSAINLGDRVIIEGVNEIKLDESEFIASRIILME